MQTVTLFDSTTLSFLKGKCGGPPISESANRLSRYITHVTAEGERRNVCHLERREVMQSLFLSEDGAHFATYTDTDDYDYSLSDAQKVTVWRYDGEEFYKLRTFRGAQKRSFCLSPDGMVIAIATGYKKAMIRFYSTSSGVLLHQWSCDRGPEFDSNDAQDESNVFDSISLAKINERYVVAHLKNTVTPQPSFPGYYFLEKNTGVTIRLLDRRVLAEFDHPQTVKVEFFENGTMLRYFEGAFGMPMNKFEKRVTFSVEEDEEEEDEREE